MKMHHSMIIDDPKAPERLRGRTITVTIDPQTHKLEFQCKIPDDATANERGYLSWAIGEMVDHLKDEFPEMVGEKTEKVVHHEDA